MTNDKFELGVDFDFHGIKVMVTGFQEKIRNGYVWKKQHFPMVLRVWDELEGAGKNPVFENSEIYYTEDGETKTLPYTSDVVFKDYTSPKNTYSINKKGIEYLVNFGKIPSLRTNFIVDGGILPYQ